MIPSCANTSGEETSCKLPGHGRLEQAIPPSLSLSCKACSALRVAERNSGNWLCIIADDGSDGVNVQALAGGPQATLPQLRYLFSLSLSLYFALFSVTWYILREQEWSIQEVLIIRRALDA